MLSISYILSTTTTFLAGGGSPPTLIEDMSPEKFIFLPPSLSGNLGNLKEQIEKKFFV